jgi:hypothetical protein
MKRDKGLTNRESVLLEEVVLSFDRFFSGPNSNRFLLQKKKLTINLN